MGFLAFLFGRTRLVGIEVESLENGRDGECVVVVNSIEEGEVGEGDAGWE